MENHVWSANAKSNYIYNCVIFFYLMTEEKRSSEDDIFLNELRRWKDIIPELMD